MCYAKEPYAESGYPQKNPVTKEPYTEREREREREIKMYVIRKRALCREQISAKEQNPVTKEPYAEREREREREMKMYVIRKRAPCRERISAKEQNPVTKEPHAESGYRFRPLRQRVKAICAGFG